jgi:hypothetical protein
MGFSGYYRTRDLANTAERRRLLQPDLLTTWRHWGPYLSDRQWGTVREWYEDDSPWTGLEHDQARSRAYRWGEDGILGICDLQGLLCFSVAMWNEADPITKERFFGLTNPEGNHGEDVKEAYFYLDNLPSHAYMKGLYKYPYRYPYSDLVDHARSIDPSEYELVNTGALDGNRYFDVFVEYAKAAPEDILIRITAVNRGPDTKTLHLLPTLCFRNTRSWAPGGPPRPSLSLAAAARPQDACIAASDVRATDPLTSQDRVLLPGRRLHCRDCSEVLFTDNETNTARLFGTPNATPFVKDGINDHIVSRGTAATVNPAHVGTKAAAHYALTLGPGETRTVDLRLTDATIGVPFDDAYERLLDQRRREADAFYDELSPYRRESDDAVEADTHRVQRQAFAGMLWCKQLYHLVVHRWLEGDSLEGDNLQLPPPRDGSADVLGDLRQWEHLYAKDVLSMPDAWEFPYFAAWDLAFHATTFAIIDPAFAKHQLELLVMEWSQHPNGQLPGCEWKFSDTNPPVQAWAAWRVFQTEREIYGAADVEFLDRVFEKLALNFTWWVNKADHEGNNIFEGGFLGMDNIRIIDADPDGNPIEQADGTAWVAMFCLNMLRIATELTALRGNGHDDRVYRYRDAARKYLQHFMYICDAMNRIADQGLWDEDHGFFMDCAHRFGRLHVFSMTGLVPLFATEEIAQAVNDPESFYDLFGFLRWFARNRRDLVEDNAHLNLDDLLAQVSQPAVPRELRGTVSIVDREKLPRILDRMLDPAQFLSPHGIRSLSKYHLDHSQVELPGMNPLHVHYEPAESVRMKRMGGNSNWCGPLWTPVNYLLMESLRKFHRMYPDLTVPYPTGSDRRTLAEVADDLEARLISIFLRDPDTGRRPVFGGVDRFDQDPQWKDYLLFYEYFHSGDRDDRDAGTGLGASHQTGWTGLVANLIQERGARLRAGELGIPEDQHTRVPQLAGT